MKKLLLFIIFLSEFAQAQLLENYPAPANIFQTSNYMNFNNKMCFFGRTSGYQWSLYSTDGTASGNQVVKNFGLQVANIMPAVDIDMKYNDYKIEYNNNIYFYASYQFWKSDGTTAGTNVFLPTGYTNPKYFKIFNGKLYFTAENNATGREICSTDGTVAGTSVLKDIYPGTNPSIDAQFDPHFTVFNNKLFFVANDGTTGFELWSTDGTTTGTSLFKDIRTSASETESNVYNQGAFKSISQYSLPPFKVINNKMYFAANSDFTYPYTNAFKLFYTDGTASGTTHIAMPIPSGSGVDANFIQSIYGLTVVNNDLIVFGTTFVTSAGGSGTSVQSGIFKLNSLNNATILPGVLAYNGDSGSGPDTEQMSMKLYNGEYYFIGYPNFTPVAELWKMNPTTFQFSQVSSPATQPSILFNTSNGFTRLLISQVWDGKLYFSKADGLNGGLFSTTGTLSSTTQVAKGVSTNATVVNYGGAGPTELQNFGSGLYFNAKLTSPIPTLWRFYNPALSTNNIESSTTTFKIYPNPTLGELNLNFEKNLDNATIKIVSLLGQTVFEKQNLSGLDFTFNVSSLNSGLYLIQLSEGQNNFISKFLKE